MTLPEGITLFFTILMILPTIASLTRFDQWWIRGFDFPRIQICILTMAVLAASLIFYDFDKTWQIISVVTLILSLGYQFLKIYPYTYLSRKQVKKIDDHKAENSISILVSNVLTPNKHSDKLIALVNKRKPDILLTLESDKRWEKELSILEKEYKYSVKVPLDNLYGMHLYSKLALEDAEVKYLVQEDIPSIHGKVILRSGTKVQIHCLHPMPPSPTESDTSTNRDAELLMVGKHIKEQHRGILVFGDLNDVAWSRTTKLFQKMSGLLDPRIGRGFFNTYHAGYPLFRWPLDHVFHSKDFGLIEITRERNVGSDHFPMFIHLYYNPSVEKSQEEPEPSTEEEAKWAEKKIQDANPLKTSF